MFGDYYIQVDVEATRAWYDAYGEIAGGCQCALSRNYAAAIRVAPPEAGKFLTKLGLEIQKPFELVERWREGVGRWLYSALYHLVGALVEKGHSELELASGVMRGFQTVIGPFAADFPEPCIQLFMDLRLPRLLDEPYPDD